MFKVFRRTVEGKLLSCLQTRYSVTFEAGIKNLPSIENSKFFAFNTLEDAERFSSAQNYKEISTSLVIWEIENVPFVKALGWTTVENQMKLFWELYSMPEAQYEDFTPSTPIFVVKPPTGTIWIDSVTLVKQIPYTQ